MNLRTFLTEYEKGSFRESDFETQVRAGWYDWFCEDSELAEKSDLTIRGGNQRIYKLILETGHPEYVIVSEGGNIPCTKISF